MKILDSLDNFKKGPWKENSVFDVADEAPEYIADLLDSGAGDAEDRETMCKAIGRPVEE